MPGKSEVKTIKFKTSKEFEILWKNNCIYSWLCLGSAHTDLAACFSFESVSGALRGPKGLRLARRDWGETSAPIPILFPRTAGLS